MNWNCWRDVDMLLLVEKVTKGRMCHAIHCYAKAKNKYMKDYDPGTELGYQELLWMGNFTKVANGLFLLEKRQVLI